MLRTPALRLPQLSHASIHLLHWSSTPHSTSTRPHCLYHHCRRCTSVDLHGHLLVPTTSYHTFQSLSDVHLKSVYLIGVCLVGIYLMDVYLMGIYFIAMHFIGVHVQTCVSWVK